MTGAGLLLASALLVPLQLAACCLSYAVNSTIYSSISIYLWGAGETGMVFGSVLIAGALLATMMRGETPVAGAAALGAGVALLPLAMFERELREGRLVQPFDTGIDLGRYWLTRLRSRREREPMKQLRLWLQAQAAVTPAR